MPAGVAPRHERAREHLVLYDGPCGLCSRAALFVARRDRQGRFRFASLQGAAGRAALARSGVDPAGLDSFHLLRGDGETPALLSRASAALVVLGQLPAPWRWLRVLGLVPLPVLDALYDLVARNRRRLFRREGCPVPTAEERARFLDP